MAMRPAPRWMVWLAFGVVYLVWGSTYLAIAVAVQTLPPLLTAGLRFLVAGCVLAAVLALRGGPHRLMVTPAELAASVLVASALLVGGNGLVMLAERDVPSGLTALIIGSVPLWVAVLRASAGERMSRLALAGVLIGFGGVAVLVLPRGMSGSVAPLGLAFLLAASACWAAGSFASGRLALPRDPFVSTSWQMVTGGILLLVAGVAAGEGSRVDPAAWSAASLVGFGYLVVFGALIAFTAYTWLLQHAPLSSVATYAYVNPVVAVLLGAMLLREEITASIVLGAVMIVASVALVVSRGTPASEHGAARVGRAAEPSRPAAR